MKKINLLFLLLIFAFNYVNAGGDDRGLGPVEVLDIIVEDSYKNVSPILSNQEKIIKNTKAKPQTKNTENITTPQLLDTIESTKVEKLEVIKTEVVEIETPVVNQRIAKTKKPTIKKIAVSKKPVEVNSMLDTVNIIADAVYKSKEENNVSKNKDFTDKPVGSATAPLEDVGEKIYKNCEDLTSDNNKIVRFTCIAIMGVFIIL